MKNSYQNCQIISNTKIANNVYKMEVQYDKYVNSGQFFMLKKWHNASFLLSRPISVCDQKNDLITFLYLKIGKGTDVFARLKSGDFIEILGPLGNGFDEKLQGKIALIGGGIGIAPLYLAGKRYEGCDIDTYLGFKDEIYFTEEFKNISKNLYIYTQSGRYGIKGLVTKDFDEEKYDYIFACGPNPMLNSLKKIVKKKEKLYLSLEKRMGCGIGACLACSQRTNKGMKTVCKDGPVFRADEITEEMIC